MNILPKHKRDEVNVPIGVAVDFLQALILKLVTTHAS